MVNVLIIGATGYIGQAVCQSLLRSGNYRVYGLARTPEKAKSLARQEVIPVPGSISDNAEIVRSIEVEHISVVVDVAGADSGSYTLLADLKKLGASRLVTASTAGTKIGKLGFIYCSGTWVHGDSNKPVNDMFPVDNPNAPNQPAQLTSWRPKLEQEVLAASDVLDVMVVRPALVYGGTCPIWSMFFGPICKAAQAGTKSISLPVELHSRPGLIHVDDVATGFHAAIDKLPLISGTGVYPIFDLVTSQESMREILEFAAKELWFEGEVRLVGAGDDLFAKAMCTSMNGSSGRARQILGWEPKRIGFVQGMDVYAKAFVATIS